MMCCPKMRSPRAGKAGGGGEKAGAGESRSHCARLLAGSGWKGSQQSGSVCGIVLPAGPAGSAALRRGDLRPSTKAAVGDHDLKTLSFADASSYRRGIGSRSARKSQSTTAKPPLMRKTRGIILCDTKFEFGLDEEGILTLMDEVLTPDFQPLTGRQDRSQSAPNPPSFRQAIRARLARTNGCEQTGAPTRKCPPEVIEKTVAIYREALSLLTAG